MTRTPLTADQIAAYQRIIAIGEAGLARIALSNPMRAVIEGRVADARRQLEA